MTTITTDVHAVPPRRRWATARTALAQTWRRATTAAGAARHRYRRPALAAAGLGCIDAAFYQFGWFAGLLVTGLSLLYFEWLGGEER